MTQESGNPVGNEHFHFLLSQEKAGAIAKVTKLTTLSFSFKSNLYLRRGRHVSLQYLFMSALLITGPSEMSPWIYSDFTSVSISDCPICCSDFPATFTKFIYIHLTRSTPREARVLLANAEYSFLAEKSYRQRNLSEYRAFICSFLSQKHF